MKEITDILETVQKELERLYSNETTYNLELQRGISISEDDEGFYKHRHNNTSTIRIDINGGAMWEDVDGVIYEIRPRNEE